MAHYKAEVFLGSNSGYQTIEVNASSINGVTEQIQRLYNVPPEYIRNVREVSNYTSSSENLDYSYGGILVLFFFVNFVFPSSNSHDC